MRHSRSAATLTTISILACATFAANVASAQEGDRRVYHMPSEQLSDALRAVSVESGRPIAAPAPLIAGKTSVAIDGEFSTQAAIRALLAGSGLRARPVETGFVIEEEPTASTDPSPADVVVTGSRIRGAAVASPVITLTNDAIRDAGQATVAQAVQSIPQNFGGGQNPGVGFNVPATSGVNVGSAASIDLRGVGSDATLTLLNGHRLSYSASRQAIDVSMIPLGAVDRIEIVPDGASALYGSDAVAGVANIILKPDYDGIETSARFGAATEGGDFEQRYGAVVGRRWNGGGIVASYEFGLTTPIDGSDRSYSLPQPSLTLLPGVRQNSAVVSGHQSLGSALEFDVDGLFNARNTINQYSLSPTGDVTASGARITYSSQSFAVAPTLRLTLSDGWQAFLTGSYGQDHLHYDVASYAAGRLTNTPNNCYCNDAKAIELGGDGSLFRLPAGAVKLAVGAGYRANTLVRFNGAGAATNISRPQESYYGYSELSVPLVSPDQHERWIDTLSLSGAVRYERYLAIGGIVTPKIGLIYAPTPDFALKGSWGKSFRAPTLYQEYAARNVVVATPATFGGVGYPAGSAALLLQGGSPTLKPERATTWTATIDIHPRAIEGAKLELSYFSIDYRDRIVTPIAFLSQALSNPLYANRINANPSNALLASIVASAASFANATGGVYNPASVAVFIDDENVNAGHQAINGVDGLLSYKTILGSTASSITASIDAAYLDSNQQLGAGQSITQLAGIIFNPPHFRARSTLGLESGAFVATANVNYIGSVEDTRKPAAVRVGSMTMLDLSARYRTGTGHGVLDGLDLVLSVQNVTDQHPARIATTLLYDAPYDSTNQSPVGRFVSFSIAKKW